MAEEDLIKKLTERGVDEKSARMIVKELFSAKEDVDLKTHFTEKETLIFTKVDFFSKVFNDEGFTDCKNLLDLFSNKFSRKRVSYSRLSRGEFVESLKPEIQQAMQEDRNKVERLLR